MYGDGCNGAVAKTYAVADASGSHVNISFNAGGDIATKSGGNGAWNAYYLNTVADKTTGIWSIEWSTVVGAVDGQASPPGAGFGESLADGNIGGSGNNGITFIPTYAGFYMSGSLTQNVTDAYPSVKDPTIKRLILFDFTNRKIGLKTAGANTISWSSAIPGTGQLHVFSALFFNTDSQKLNTGQTPFTTENKGLLATVSGANEGIYI